MLQAGRMRRVDQGPIGCRIRVCSTKPGFLIAVSVMLTASPSAAQTWAPEQQEALTVVEQSWEADLAKDAAWIDRLTHPEMLSWGSAFPVPRSQAVSRRWSEYQDESFTALLHTIAPVGVAVRGDAAVVHYYATLAEENREGEHEVNTLRCTDTLTREGGDWRYLGWFCHREPNDDN